MISRTSILAAAALMLAACTTAQAQEMTGTYYFPDKPFPEYMPLWQEGWSFKNANGDKLIYAKPDMPLGGYAFVYYKNTTAKPITVTDLTVDGVKMSQALAQDIYPKAGEEKFRTTLLMSKLPKAQIDTVEAAGWPVWWKPEPKIVEPGACGEIVIRMRRSPKPAEINVGIITDSGQFSAKVATTKSKPQFGTISFSPDLKTVYLYARHPKAGTKPVKVLVDSKDVTASAEISWDKTVGLSPIVVKLAQPLKLMSYHNFCVLYADDSAAQAGIRAWGHDMVYGMWSSPGGGGDPEAATKGFIEEYVYHNLNAVMPYVIGACRDYFFSDAGWDYCEKMGVDRMIHWPEANHDALFLFAMDEPDANDASFGDIPEQDRLGNLGQFLVNWTRQLHKSGPNSPVLLNIDNTYKPENWYMYHQLPDIPCVDPYFPEQQDFAVENPYAFAAHTRPTYVQGVCAISQSSGQPKPLHAILCSTRYRGRYPTPEEKRMEVFYAIASGAKGISYWWFPKDSGCHGLDERTPEACALWKEIGILGGEVRTAGLLIPTSCPVDLPSKASKFLWVRSLLCGGDTVAVITVNDNVACDRMGTIVKPCEKAQVSVQLPSWINPKSVIEVTSDGIKDVPSKRDGGKLTLDLGTVNVSRFVLITSNTDLKAQLQKRFDEKFAKNVRDLKAGS